MAGILFAFLALSSSAAPLAFVMAVLVHEAAHILCAAALGWGLPRFSAGICGFRLSYSRLAPAAEELSVCVAGPLANLFLSAFLFALGFCPALALYSLGLGVLNLLPVSCLDGGGILSAFLSLFLLPDTVCRILSVISVIFVLALWALNIYIQLLVGVNVTLLALSVYLTVTVLSRPA